MPTKQLRERRTVAHTYKRATALRARQDASLSDSTSKAAPPWLSGVPVSTNRRLNRVARLAVQLAKADSQRSFTVHEIAALIEGGEVKRVRRPDARAMALLRARGRLAIQRVQRGERLSTLPGPTARKLRAIARTAAQLSREDAGRFMLIPELTDCTVALVEAGYAARAALDRGEDPAPWYAVAAKVTSKFGARLVDRGDLRGLVLGVEFTGGAHLPGEPLYIA